MGITSISAALFAGLAVLVTYLMWRSGTQAQAKKEGIWEGEVKSFLKTFDKRLSDLEKQVAHLVRFLAGVFGREVIRAESPLRLTDFGESISEEIAAREWVNKVSESLIDKIEGKDAYEIQVFCFEYAGDIDNYSDDEQREIRDSAHKRGIKASDIRRVKQSNLPTCTASQPSPGQWTSFAQPYPVPGYCACPQTGSHSGSGA